MPEFKLVISNPKNGFSAQREAKESAAKALIGLKIGDNVAGDSIGLPGFEFQVTGGSDYCGFPMRKDIRGVGRKKILAVSGVGFRRFEKGIRQRKTVCGNTIHERIAQVNLKIVKEGKENLFESAEKKATENKAAKEAKRAEKKPAEKKPADKPADKKAEPKPAEKKAEHPEKKEHKAAEQKPAEHPAEKKEHAAENKEAKQAEKPKEA